MKKISLFCLILTLIPSVVFGESARFRQLVVEKQRKMEQLEKCTGSAKGLMIAGISTLGLTAVGVAGNIAEAKVIEKNDVKIEKNDKTIEKTKEEIERKRDELYMLALKSGGGKPISSDKQKTGSNEKNTQGLTVKTVVEQDIAKIVKEGNRIGGQAILRGYYAEQLPADLEEAIADAQIRFISDCQGLAGKNGIATVTLGNYMLTKEQIPAITFNEDDILPDLQEHIEIECLINECENKYTQRGNVCVADNLDCTSEKQAEDSNVVVAVRNNNLCEVKDCKSGFEPSDDKTSCKSKSSADPEVFYASCDVEVKNEAYMKWNVPGYHTDDQTNTYAVAVDEDTDIYNKYQDQKNSRVEKENKKTKKYFDEKFFDAGTIFSYKCKNMEFTSRNCIDQTMKQCDENFYNCYIEKKYGLNETEASREFFDKYKTELTQTICGG